jgi:hypothetical protein
MKKTSLFIFLVSLISGAMFSQNQPTSQFALEIDPAPFFLNGYSISVKYSSGQLAKLAGMASVFQSDFPDKMMLKINRDRGWTDMKMERSYAVFLEYYLRNSRKGFYSGPAVFWYNKSVALEESGKRTKFRTLYPNLRIGYIWYPFKSLGLYVNPWINVGSEFNLDHSNQIDNIEFAPSRFQYIVAIHLCYSISY